MEKELERTNYENNEYKAIKTAKNQELKILK